MSTRVFVLGMGPGISGTWLLACLLVLTGCAGGNPDGLSAGRERGSNSRNGTRSKKVLTDAGPVEIEVPRDRDGSFEPRLIKERQRSLTGVDEMVISLTAKGLTAGEVSAHVAEVYGADVSTDTVSRITDRVLYEKSGVSTLAWAGTLAKRST
jgi:hypothetical protein